jgi:hypothetical protein
MLTPAYPEWLPPAVARRAEALLIDWGDFRHDVGRLATDERMEAVWRELRRHSPDEAALTVLLNTSWVTLDELKQCRPDETALVVFFEHAFWNTVLPPRAATVSEFNTLRNTYLHHAAQLRASAKWLHEAVNLKKRPLPATFPLVLGTLGFLPGDIANHASCVEAAAALCDKVAAAISDLCAAGHPLIVDRDRGNALARGYVRLMADTTLRLFGTPLYGTLAKVASVALALREDLTREQVLKWCTNKDA